MRTGATRDTPLAADSDVTLIAGRAAEPAAAPPKFRRSD
jgi:hypothetical protein